MPLKTLAILAMMIGLSACPSTETADPDSPQAKAVTQHFAAPGAIVQRHPGTEIAWTVDEAGKVKAAVRTSARDAITTQIEGELTWKDASGSDQKAPLKLDPQTGLLETDAVLKDATDIRYTLTVKDKPIRGTLELREPSPPPATAEPTPTPETSTSATAPTSTTTPSRPTPAPAPTATSTSERRKEESGRFPPKR